MILARYRIARHFRWKRGPVHTASVTATRERRWSLTLPRNVLVLGLVSLFADVSSEMVYPLLPVFLVDSLGAPALAVGLIEGVAEGTASVVKAISGRVSDRVGVRRPFVVGGYALSAAAKPLLAAAFVWPAVLGIRFVDRFGKGLRTAPRDALVAETTPERIRGRAFGFHRAADTAGAIAGPLIALGILALTDDRLRVVFLIAVVPGIVSIVLLRYVAEARGAVAASDRRATIGLRHLGSRYYVLLLLTLLFTLGNSSDAFLLLRADDLGLGASAIVLAYVTFNASYALLATPAGSLSDRIGRRNVILVGWVTFALVYFAFAAVDGTGPLWVLFPLYGLVMATTDGVGRAFVVDFAPADQHGTALGLYHAGIGVMTLVASLLAGLLWDAIDPSAPFYVGGATALVAGVLMFFALPATSDR